jgi:hypothetical protein
VRENQVTPTRGRILRQEQPLTLAQSLLHLRDRANLMRTKRQRVWLRWNRSDVEAVDRIIAAFAKPDESKEETTMEYEVPFTLAIESDSLEEAAWAAETVQKIVQTEIRRAEAMRSKTARDRRLVSITAVEFGQPRETAGATAEG